jgi:hypothetical protein
MISRLQLLPYRRVQLKGALTQPNAESSNELVLLLTWSPRTSTASHACFSAIPIHIYQTILGAS